MKHKEACEMDKLKNVIANKFDWFLVDQKQKLLDDLIKTEERAAKVDKLIRETRDILGIPNGVPSKDWRIEQAIH